MSIRQIRDSYGVPAKRGGRIEFLDTNGHCWTGVIRSARDCRIRVQLDGLKRVSTLHPTWNVRYL